MSMNPLLPQDLARFARKYRFAGGRVMRCRISYRKGRPTLDVTMRVRTAIVSLSDEPKLVKVKLRIVDVEEFRWQKRPGFAGGKMADLRLGSFNGMLCANFDAYALDPGEQPGLHDIRASDAYAAGRELWWEELDAPSE